MLKAADKTVATAAATGLGRIGGQEADQALAAAEPTVSAEIKPAVAECGSA